MKVIANRAILTTWVIGPEDMNCAAIVLSGTLGFAYGPVYEDGRWKVSVRWNEVLIADGTRPTVFAYDYDMDVDPDDIVVR